MLLFANLLDLRNVFDVFRLVVDTEGELSLDVDVHHPTIAQKKEFSEYRRQVEVLRGLLAENKNNNDAFMNLLAYQAKCAEIANAAIAGEKPVIVAPEEKKETKVADIKDWEGVKTMPAPKPQMDLEGITWVLVDEIEILNKESEDKHIFTIKEAKDSYRSRQKLKYPGRHHGRGHRSRARRRLQRVQAAQHHGRAAGRAATPHGLRVRRLRARAQRQRQEGRDRVVLRHRSRASLAQLAGDDPARVGHRRHAARAPAVDHRRPRHQHVPHLGLSAEVARKLGERAVGETTGEPALAW